MNVNGSYDAKAGTAGADPSRGSTSIQLSNSGVNQKQDTNATIGNGTIVTQSDISKLNRDIKLSQVMTKNQKTGGLSIDLTIDNQAITNPGAYFKPLTELPQNITQAADNVANAAKNLKLTFDEKVKSKSMDGFTADYKGKIRGQELNLQAKIDPKVVEALKTLSKNPEFAEAELEKVLNKAAKISGVDGSVDIEFYRADDGTMGAHKNGKIFINLAYQTGTTETLMNVLGNELSHYVDYKQGKAYDATRQSVSTYYGDDAERQAIASLGGNTVTLEQALSFQADVSKLDFSQTNAEVAGIAGLEKKVTVYSRDVDGTGGWGQHLFIVVDQSNYLDGKPRVISLDGGTLKKPKATINTVNGFENDQNSLTGDNGQRVTISQVIAIPKGMTEQQFDELVIANAKRYDLNNPSNKYPWAAGLGQPSARNSNTFSDNVIEQSGGKVAPFPLAIRQNSGEIKEGVMAMRKLVEVAVTDKTLAKARREFKKEVRDKQGFK